MKSRTLCSRKSFEVHMSLCQEKVVPDKQYYLLITFVGETTVCTLLLMKDVFHLSCIFNAGKNE